ncbi:MAG: hypothetical protein AVDCRST_MAG17-287, partial [uncultured Solirubrobacterales bacterium]
GPRPGLPAHRRLAAARLDAPRARPAHLRRGALRRGGDHHRPGQSPALLEARLALAPAGGQRVRPRRRSRDRPRDARGHGRTRPRRRARGASGAVGASRGHGDLGPARVGAPGVLQAPRPV